MEQIDRDELRRLAALVDPGDVTGDEALGRIVAAVPQLLADLETAERERDKLVEANRHARVCHNYHERMTLQNRDESEIIDQLRADRDRYRERAERLAEALRWYGDEANYDRRLAWDSDSDSALHGRYNTH